MLSQQLRNSGSLLDSIDAVRNWRAVGLLLATLVAMGIVIALGTLLGRVSVALTFLFVLAGFVVMFYGVNACGMMIMDEAKGQASRPAMAAVMQSLATSHRLILVFLLLGALYLAAFIVLAVVLFICKIPFIGPVLYAVVFPVSVVVFGIAMFALPMVVFPLSAPAIWNGARTMECVSQLLAIARKRLLTVMLMMIAVAFIAGVVAFLIGIILFYGAAVTTLASAPILGMGGLGGVMGMMDGGMAGMSMGGAMGHAIGAGIGGGILFAIAFTLPGMVYLRGACTVYLRAVDGLDLAAEQADIDTRLAAAKARAQEYANRESVPPPVAAPVAAAAAVSPSNTPVIDPTDPLLALACPKCHAAISVTDAFCGECGHRLQ